jgi:hypothetical protein
MPFTQIHECGIFDKRLMPHCDKRFFESLDSFGFRFG